MSADDSAPKSPDLSSLSLPFDDTPQSQPYLGTGQPQLGPYYQQPPAVQQQPYQFPFSHPSPQQQPQLQQHQPHIPSNTASYSSYQQRSSSIGHYTPPQIQPQAQQQQSPVGYELSSPSSYNKPQSYYQTQYGGAPQQGYQVQAYQVPQQYNTYNKSTQRNNSLQPNPSPPPPVKREEVDIKPQLHGLSQPQPTLSDNSTMPPRRTASASGSQQSSAVTPSPVKTKFPTARIKRIMQADEEVGKVAQQTPIAVGKALEMFMIALVTKSAEVAKEKNSKRVTAQMLKQVVESDEQWDFLHEIVGKVEGEEKKAGGKSKSAKNESDDTESEEEVVEKKKRGGRKKKV